MRDRWPPRGFRASLVATASSWVRKAFLSVTGRRRLRVRAPLEPPHEIREPFLSEQLSLQDVNREALDRPGRACLFKAVEHGAVRRRRHAWTKYTVAMDPEDLVLAEQATYDPTGAAIAVPV